MLEILVFVSICQAKSDGERPNRLASSVRGGKDERRVPVFGTRRWLLGVVMSRGLLGVG